MNTKNTITKKVALEIIESSFPSIWSREDVTNLINRIEPKVLDRFWFENQEDVNSFSEWLNEFTTITHYSIDYYIEVMADYDDMKKISYEFQKRHVIQQESKEIDWDDLISEINSEIDDISQDDMFSNSDFEFSIVNGNEISVDYDIDRSYIRDAVDTAVVNFKNKLNK